MVSGTHRRQFSTTGAHIICLSQCVRSASSSLFVRRNHAAQWNGSHAFYSVGGDRVFGPVPASGSGLLFFALSAYYFYLSINPLTCHAQDTSRLMGSFPCERRLK